MSWVLLQAAVVLYVLGLLRLHRRQRRLLLYMWGALGFALLAIRLALLQGWDVAISGVEVRNVQTLAAPLGIDLQRLDQVTLLVPDPTGWSSLRFTIECSTLIELSVLAGLILFYPRLSLRKRWTYLLVGCAATYALNLLRVILIVLLIGQWGKPIVPIAHTVVGRLVYFAGVILIYWFLLTRPTLGMVHRSIEASGRAVR